jgi:hypothetical protein
LAWCSQNEKLLGKFTRKFFQDLFGWKTVSDLLLFAQAIEKKLAKDGVQSYLFNQCVDALMLASHEIPSLHSINEYQQALAPIKNQSIQSCLAVNLWHLAYNKETYKLAPGSMEVFEKFQKKELNYSQSIATIENNKKQLVEAI